MHIVAETVDYVVGTDTCARTAALIDTATFDSATEVCQRRTNLDPLLLLGFEGGFE